MSSDNAAAFLVKAKAHPFQVQSAPAYTPGDDQILVKNHVVAINPVDGNLQYMAFFPLNYPTILGSDVAGEVVSVGPNVTRFKAGDRVIGHAVAMATGKRENAGFQRYTVLETSVASHIPDSMPFEQAVVLPLGLSTAVSGLFRPDFLGLQLPSSPPTKATGETVLVWGGASSVGSNAIQLCKAAGYDVITTASPKNFDYVKKLGASEAFDYSSSTVHADLIDAFKGKKLAGIFDSIGAAAWPICLDIADKSDGKKFVATCKRGYGEPPAGVKIEGVFGATIKDTDVGKFIYAEYLPKALEDGSFVPLPEAKVVGEGLESLQAAVDQHRAGVSASKLVVRL